MDDTSRQRLKVLRTQYPAGCKVELVHMEDSQAPMRGTKGTVVHIDDIGTIHVAWKNGSTLGIIPGIDLIRKLTEEIPRK